MIEPPKLAAWELLALVSCIVFFGALTIAAALIDRWRLTRAAQ